MVPNGDLDAFLEVNLDQNRFPNQLFWKRADVRLDRAGSIGLRVGPLHPEKACYKSDAILKLRFYRKRCPK